MARAYLGLGGNIGDPRRALQAAVAQLREVGTLVAVSSLYETAPVGFTDQPPFLNAALALDTQLGPHELLAALLEVERSQHRQRTFQNAPRTLDLDVLFYDGQIIEMPGLTIPHPRVHERAFALVPLAEIAADLRHPTLRLTVGELLARLGDVSDDVQVIAGPDWAEPAL